MCIWVREGSSFPWALPSFDLVDAVFGTSVDFSVVNDVRTLLPRSEADVGAITGHQGLARREGVQDIQVNWCFAIRRGNHRALDRQHALGDILDRIEQLRDCIFAMMKHPFGVIEGLSGQAKVFAWARERLSPSRCLPARAGG